MNILFVSAVLPYPLYSGGQIRIYNLLKQLSKKHSITLLSFIRSEKERNFAKHLSFLSDVHMVYRGHAVSPRYLCRLYNQYPLLLTSYNNSQMRTVITDTLRNTSFDLLHIEPFYVYPSLPKYNVPLVVCEHNIEHEVYQKNAQKFPFQLLRPIFISDAKKIYYWEKEVWKKASSVIAVSDEDANKISSVTKKNVSIVPNGVDISHFSYTKHAFDRNKISCVFIGNFSWLPNKEAVSRLLKTIWPIVIEKFPTARLTIIGKHFPSGLHRYITNTIQLSEDVDDIRESYVHSDILLAPMGIGGGTKFKILEAMASGTAVISSPEGIMGLTVTNNTHVIVADADSQYPSMIEKIVASPKKAQEMTKAARLLIERQFSWITIADKLERVWKAAV